MEYEQVLYSVSSITHVAHITLNRPESLNTFNTRMSGELYDALMAAESDRSVRVILIEGAGKSFCAGIDVKELAGKTALEYREWIERMERPLLAIAKIKKPVIVQLHGVAAANGMGLAAAADLVIAADTARMGLTAIKVGLNCVGPILPVARCVGRKKALELLLFGDLISATEAERLGLVNRTVPENRLAEEAQQWAETLASRSPVAVQLAKSGFYAAEDMAYEQQFTYMNEVFARLCTSEDAKEGVQAFFEKRDPVWQEK
ncbi:MAG: enoyl-CoA hydratase/isomerase family protein [Desulfobulbaceae bacterium]|jgi:enoyl-CoA hydratase/carnithine racemase|nr:enoyl-CoA hydratase/isomerase family protein [Desulfobulbaceae bacterium]